MNSTEAQPWNKADNKGSKLLLHVMSVEYLTCTLDVLRPMMGGDVAIVGSVATTVKPEN